MDTKTVEASLCVNAWAGVKVSGAQTTDGSSGACINAVKAVTFRTCVMELEPRDLVRPYAESEPPSINLA